MEELTSRSNGVIKNCRSLAADAKERREQGLVFLEGQRLCCEAAAAGAVVEQLLVTQAALLHWEEALRPLLAAAQRSFLVTEAVAGCISQTKSSQGVYCLCHMPQPALPDFAQGGGYLLLDRLQDPGNLGAIIRCAEAFGVASVLLSRDCADLWSPKVLRSTMGSCFRQAVAVVDSLPDTIAQMRTQGVSVYAAALDAAATTPAQLPRNGGGIAAVIGNEGNGVSVAVRQACNGCVYIPMTAQIESLNAATAAAILMWELCGRDR